MAAQQTHATITGIHAGQPYCGIGRSEMLRRGDRGMHIIGDVEHLVTCADCRHVMHCQDDACFERDHQGVPHPDQPMLIEV